jgi:ribosomal protein S27E
MKNSYNKSIQLRCITCGDSDFEFNEDKSWIKCNRCGKEYSGGYDELLELNQQLIKQEMEKTKSEVLGDVKKDLSDIFKNAFKGDKFIKFKG